MNKNKIRNAYNMEMMQSKTLHLVLPLRTMPESLKNQLLMQHLSVQAQ